MELTFSVAEHGLEEQDMINMFANHNMANLEFLSLAGFDTSIVTDELIGVIADNCPKLYYFNLYKAQIIGNDCIGYLIRKLANLHYLSVRKCYDLDTEFMYHAVKRSPSDELKIDTIDGVIVWNKAKGKAFLDRHDWSLWDANFGM